MREVSAIKSALRNEVQVAEKKKVAFLDGSRDEKLKAMKDGSTTSIASSVFDASKPNLERKVESDVSDWDISEIIE